MDRCMCRLRDSRPHGSLNHFYEAFLLGFFWPLALAGSEAVFGVSQSSPTCVHASLSQDGF